MGQRLNIQIQRGETILANAYYHWSAYTGSALELLKTIHENWDKLSNEENDIIRAVRLLEATGAGLTQEELFNVDILGQGFVPQNVEINRNDGLIAVSPEGIAETNDWAEGGAIIDLDDAMVSFDVFYAYDDRKHILSDYEEDEIADLPELDFQLDMSSFKLEHAGVIASALDESGEFVFKTKEEEYFSIIA